MSKYCLFILPEPTLILADKGSYEFNVFKKNLDMFYEMFNNSGVKPVFILESEMINSGKVPLDREDLTFTSVIGQGDRFFYEANCEIEFSPNKENIVTLPYMGSIIKEAINRHKAEVVKDPQEFLLRRIAVLSSRISYAINKCKDAANVVVIFKNNKRTSDVETEVGTGRLVVEVLLKSGIVTIKYGGVEVDIESLPMIMEVL